MSYYYRGITFQEAATYDEAMAAFKLWKKEERKKEKLAQLAEEKARQDAIKLENSRFQSSGFLENMRIAATVLELNKPANKHLEKHNWGKDLEIVMNPEQRCCYCGVGVPTNRVWFFNRDRTKLVGVVRMDGVEQLNRWHPHVNGVDICRGDGNGVDGVQALFLGLNPNSAFFNVKEWLKSTLKHKCWWDSALPHTCDPTSWITTECGCSLCRYCQKPICKCIAQILSKSHQHGLKLVCRSKPLSRETFNELIAWAEKARVDYSWSDEEVLYNANYLAKLDVEPLPVEGELIQQIQQIENLNPQVQLTNTIATFSSTSTTVRLGTLISGGTENV